MHMYDFMLSASYLKASQGIPKERMFSQAYIFLARNLNREKNSRIFMSHYSAEVH